MKDWEREEINNLPIKYQPLSPMGNIGYHLLFALPLVGFICMLIFSFSDDNINRRNLARSFLILWLVGVAFAVIIFIIVIVALGGALSNIGKV